MKSRSTPKGQVILSLRYLNCQQSPMFLLSAPKGQLISTQWQRPGPGNHQTPSARPEGASHLIPQVSQLSPIIYISAFRPEGAAYLYPVATPWARKPPYIVSAPRRGKSIPLLINIWPLGYSSRMYSKNKNFLPTTIFSAKESGIFRILVI